jgi:hypothetical protein
MKIKKMVRPVPEGGAGRAAWTHAHWHLAFLFGALIALTLLMVALASLM